MQVRNLAFAVGQAQGAERGLAQIRSDDVESLERYPYAHLVIGTLLADAGREMGNPASQLSLPAIAPRSARDRDTIGLACKIAFSDPAAWDKPTPAVSPITSERAFVTAPFLKMLYWRTAAVISAMVCAGVASALLQLPNQWHSKTLAAASPVLPAWGAELVASAAGLLRTCIDVALAVVQGLELLRGFDALFIWRMNTAGETSVFRSQTATELATRGGLAIQENRGRELAKLKALAESDDFKQRAPAETNLGGKNPKSREEGARGGRALARAARRARAGCREPAHGTCARRSKSLVGPGRAWVGRTGPGATQERRTAQHAALDPRIQGARLPQ